MLLVIIETQKATAMTFDSQSTNKNFNQVLAVPQFSLPRSPNQPEWERETDIENSRRGHQYFHSPAIFAPEGEEAPSAPTQIRRMLRFDPSECGLTEPKHIPDPTDREDSQLDGDELLKRMGYHFHQEEALAMIENNGEEEVVPEVVPVVVPVPEDVPEVPDAPQEPEVAKDNSLEQQLDAEIEKPDREYKSSAVAREHSRKWHQNWVKKGVPRVSKEATEKVKGGSGASSSSSSSKNLAKAKDEFISKWIQKSDMKPSNDRRNAAIKAWMASSERSNFMAGSQGVQK